MAPKGMCVVCVCMCGAGPPLTVVVLFCTGCPGMWDNLTCWKPARVGEMVLVSCPELFRIFNPDQGEFLPGVSLGRDWSSLLLTLEAQAFLGHRYQGLGHPTSQYSLFQSSHASESMKLQTLVHTG